MILFSKVITTFYWTLICLWRGPEKSVLKFRKESYFITKIIQPYITMNRIFSRFIKTKIVQHDGVRSDEVKSIIKEKKKETNWTALVIEILSILCSQSAIIISDRPMTPTDMSMTTPVLHPSYITYFRLFKTSSIFICILIMSFLLTFIFCFRLAWIYLLTKQSYLRITI